MDKLNLLFCGEKKEESGFLTIFTKNIFTAWIAKISML